MISFFNWLIRFFKPETLQKKEKERIPGEEKVENMQQKPLHIPRRQNVVQQDVEAERKRSNRSNRFSDERKKSYKRKGYKRKKRPDSKNRKQDV